MLAEHVNDLLEFIHGFGLSRTHFSIGMDDVIHVGIDLIPLRKLDMIEMLEGVFDYLVVICGRHPAVGHYGIVKSFFVVALQGEMFVHFFQHDPFFSIVQRTIGMGDVNIEVQNKVAERFMNDHRLEIVT